MSIEVDPRLARETDPTIAEAKQLWWLVDRPNMYIKIPATAEGVPAITATLAEGISVNVTLIFSLERYAEVIDAYMAGLEQAAANGHDISTIASVASFFVSRVDTEVDKRLNAIGTPRGPGAQGQGGHRQRAARLRAVRAEAGHRPLARARRQGREGAAAAVGVDLHQGPVAARTRMYVVDLVAADTVNTMPEATLHATADHGVLRGDTVHGTYDESRALFASLEALGISYDDVVKVLEDEGVSKFEVSWNEMLADDQERAQPELIARFGTTGGSDHGRAERRQPRSGAG